MPNLMILGALWGSLVPAVSLAADLPEYAPMPPGPIARVYEGYGTRIYEQRRVARPIYRRQVIEQPVIVEHIIRPQVIHRWIREEPVAVGRYYMPRRLPPRIIEEMDEADGLY